MSSATASCRATVHCRTLSAGTLDPPDWQAAGDWVRDRVELRPARQDRAPHRVAGGYTVNFPAITPGTPDSPSCTVGTSAAPALAGPYGSANRALSGLP